MGRGRPPKEIDKEQFEKLCEIQCTRDEICEVLDVTDKTLTGDKTLKLYFFEFSSNEFKNPLEFVFFLHLFGNPNQIIHKNFFLESY